MLFNMLQFLGALFFRGIFATREWPIMVIIPRYLGYATVFLEHFFCKFGLLSRLHSRMKAFVFLGFAARALALRGSATFLCLTEE